MKEKDMNDLPTPSEEQTYTEVKGVQWCITHQGIVDECGDSGEHCDMAEPETCDTCGGEGTVLDGESEVTCETCDGEREIWGCDIRTLYVQGATS